MKQSRFNVLIACEESQVVTKAFRDRGFRAFSCDLQNPSGNLPGYHIKGDALLLLKAPVRFKTMDEQVHYVKKWHLMIAHPPCTYITKASATSLFKGKSLNSERWQHVLESVDFFMQFYNAPIELICVENPVPFRIVPIPRPTTYVQPYWFGSKYMKKTCLWLKNLPPLMPTLIYSNPVPWVNGRKTKNGKLQRGVRSSKKRSKTDPFLAQAFAQQYGDFLMTYYNYKLKDTISK